MTSSGLEHKKMPISLNESPSEKEGKLAFRRLKPFANAASMKALPKRKGNHHVSQGTR